MSIELTILKINQELISAFAELDRWFDNDESSLRSKFVAHQWNAAEILEHVMLTNHHLLLLIEKGSTRAQELARERDFTDVLKEYCFDVPGIEDIATPGIFAWHREDHLKPEGAKPLSALRRELRDQLYRCLCQLDMLGSGEGILFQRPMPVHQLGKLDVYQHVYFLALHAQRHVKQLEGSIQASSIDWLI